MGWFGVSDRLLGSKGMEAAKILWDSSMHRVVFHSFVSYTDGAMDLNERQSSARSHVSENEEGFQRTLCVQPPYLPRKDRPPRSFIPAQAH